MCGILCKNVFNLEHEAQQLHPALWTPFACPGNGVELCNSVTAFCVELHCDGKKMTYYFSLFQRKVFLFIVCFYFGNFSTVHFLLLIVVFFTRKCGFNCSFCASLFQ